MKHAMTLIGILVVFGTAVYFIDDWKSPPGEVLEEFYPSPDGKYSAQHIWKARQRSISVYCYEEIYVFSSSMTPLDKGRGQGHRVYVASCKASFSGFNYPQIEWQGSKELIFGYWLNSYGKAAEIGEDFNVARVETLVSW